ncbi:MAG: hypothetical protein ACLTEE_16625 [Anaerobutyricum hallii]
MSNLIDEDADYLENYVAFIYCGVEDISSHWKEAILHRRLRIKTRHLIKALLLLQGEIQ